MCVEETARSYRDLRPEGKLCCCDDNSEQLALTPFMFQAIKAEKDVCVCVFVFV